MKVAFFTNLVIKRFNYTYSTENKTCEMALLACLVQHCLQSIK